MEAFRNGKEWSEAFDANDVRKLFNRLKTAVAGPGEGAQEAGEQLAKIEASGRGKEAKKRELLRAWVKDPNFTDVFWQDWISKYTMLGSCQRAQCLNLACFWS